MLCQCVELFRRICIDILKGIRPALVIVKCFYVPCIIRNCKKSRLGCLCLLHRVCHNAFDIFYINVRVKKASLPHQQPAVIDIIYRPVQPEQRSPPLAALCSVIPEMIQCSLLHRLAHSLPGPEYLNLFRESGIICIQLRVISLPCMIVSGRAEYRVKHIALFFTPFYHCVHNRNDNVLIQTSDIIAKHAELTHARTVKLFKLVQERLCLSLNIPGVKSSHKRMRGPDKTALRRLSGRYHLFDPFQVFRRIKLAPLTRVVRIIFRCEHIRSHLKLSPELHQRDPVLI